MIVVLALGGCRTLPPQTFVDGYPIGEIVACDDADCARFSNFAIGTLDELSPDHAPVVEVEAYTPDYRTADGQGKILTTRSGGHDLIMVLRLADGGVRAFHIGCGVGVDVERCFVGGPPGQ